MNLMKEFKSKNRSEKIQNILENKKNLNIKLVPIKEYTVQFKQSYYFLDCVPLIPDEYNVIAKWDSCLPIRVNWNKDENVNYYDLKQQYEFVAQLESVETNKSTKRKDVISCHMVFNNYSNCEKHLRWFNSCFPMEENKEEKQEIIKKKKKKK